MTTTQSEPVLVIGAGPTGLSAALCLGRLDVPTVLAERRPCIGTLPRATGVRTRTMELFRSWGIEEQIREQALKSEGPGEFVWSRTLAGAELSRLRVSPDESDLASRRAVSPTMTVFCPQDVIEPILLDAVRAQASVEFRPATTVGRLDQDRDGVTAELADFADRSVTRRFSHVLACDGPASGVRDQLGIGTAGPPLAVDFVTEPDTVAGRFVPWAGPGYRSPHHLVEQDGKQISTLDLFGTGFVLLAAEGGVVWADAAVVAAQARGVPLRAYRFAVAAEPVTSDGPVGRLIDPDGGWVGLAGIGTSGASLVRPDGHVAWRTDQTASGDAAAVLGAALDHVLGRVAAPHW